MSPLFQPLRLNSMWKRKRKGSVDAVSWIDAEPLNIMYTPVDQPINMLSPQLGIFCIHLYLKDRPHFSIEIAFIIEDRLPDQQTLWHSPVE